MKNMKHSWGTIQRLASDRQGWRSFVAALFVADVTSSDCLLYTSDAADD